ncbi:fumarate reductase subunit FrdD [Aromatoleum petrolei]|uniref:Fumarate reductase subunit FrdD n=1 Tax=Aromatoleum petrolei TaxID=76116 RepID=A0ABX1MS43_9RHOO|nr:fumarate reductase subunit FrdD [Aromatoleum petrolei]NMF90603.1 fumarate reductase subunit FrdD [Aromatoleum petrolei]QTQ37138.1 Fumarate reductase, subunit D [Aromatoleum petrolei]
MKPISRRSHAPIFWGLFGAGGMLAALFGPVLVFITGIAVPLGFIVPADAMSWPRMQAFAQHWAGKGVLFIVIALFMWHAMHRILHSLHDLGVHAGFALKVACYGLALLATMVTAWLLMASGF